MNEDAKPIIAEQIIDNPQAAFADVDPCTPEIRARDGCRYRDRRAEVR